MAADAAFQRAVRHVAEAHGLAVGQDDRLRFYGLFKQAAAGDCKSAAPSRWNVVAHAKWAAWHDLQGTTSEQARQQYIELLQKIDPAFAVGPPAADGVVKHVGKAAPPASGNSGDVAAYPSDAVPATPGTDSDSGASPEPSSGVAELAQFRAQAALGALLLSVGMSGFLVTVLSPTALLFLGMALAGMGGVAFACVELLRANGLVAIYPPILRRILLERTMVEVILEGTIMQQIKDFITEVYPIIYCKTPEERLAVLNNMSEKTRRMMTTKGIVNLLPKWQQRVTLSATEFSRQKRRLANDSEAYRPKLIEGVCGQPAQLAPSADLNKQRRLAAKLLGNTIKDRVAATLLARVNPERCKQAALILAATFLAQLRISRGARTSVVRFLRASLLRGTSIGALTCLVLALAHQIAKRYHSHRMRLMKGN